MDCCLCGAMVHIYRPPRNTICLSCFEGARAILDLSQKLDDQAKEDSKPDSAAEPQHQTTKSPRETARITEQKGLAHAYKKMKQLRLMEATALKKAEFLAALGEQFRTRMHTDIELVTDDGLSVHAHRAVLSTHSPIFRVMFEADCCKAADKGAVHIPELSHEELGYMLEFMYTAEVPARAMEEHAHALLAAADKYDIPELKEACEDRIAATMDDASALVVLELASVCSAARVKERAMNVIVRKYEDIVVSQVYESFALKNPLLALQLTQAFVKSHTEKTLLNCEPL